jgi:hypothetical protein
VQIVAHVGDLFDWRPRSDRSAWNSSRVLSVLDDSIGSRRVSPRTDARQQPTESACCARRSPAIANRYGPGRRSQSARGRRQHAVHVEEQHRTTCAGRQFFRQRRHGSDHLRCQIVQVDNASRVPGADDPSDVIFRSSITRLPGARRTRQS